MSIFDFVPQEVFEDLPDDPNLAFTKLVSHAEQRLAERTSQLEHNESWNQLEDLRQSFMNVILAIARHYGIEPFASYQVPTVQGFKMENYWQFKSDLNFYVAQLVLDNSARTKRESVQLVPAAKDRIRTHLHALKKLVDESNLSDAKKAALLEKLRAFEEELDKGRMSLRAVTLFWLGILQIPGGVWGSVDIVMRLTNNIGEVIAEAKEVEDEARRLAPTAEPKALIAPRPVTPAPPPADTGGWDSDDKDEIPF
ncbi:MAG: hypothetical protein AB7I36_11320 [Rhodospirillaceae bacterium]